MNQHTERAAPRAAHKLLTARYDQDRPRAFGRRISLAALLSSTTAAGVLAGCNDDSRGDKPDSESIGGTEGEGDSDGDVTGTGGGGDGDTVGTWGGDGDGDDSGIDGQDGLGGDSGMGGEDGSGGVSARMFSLLRSVTTSKAFPAW